MTVLGNWRKVMRSYTETEEPMPVPNNPEIKIATP